VWLHPPKKIELNFYDELFVLCENVEKENHKDNQKEKSETGGQAIVGKKKEGTKIQNEIMKDLNKLNSNLKDLLFSSKELLTNVQLSGDLL
jgi:hypothetical protein